MIDFSLHFPNLVFDEKSHTYTVDGQKLTSASRVISELYEPFDQDAQSKIYAEKHNLTQKEVLSAWQTSNKKETNEGSRVHDFAEKWTENKYIKKVKTPLPKSKQDLAVMMWWMDLFKVAPFIQIAGLEVQMYCLKYGIAGTADILLEDTRNGNIIIADWKTNKKLESDFNNGLLKHIELPVSNYNKYQVQFSIYQVMLEEAGFKVVGRRLIWLRQDKTTRKLYKTFATDDLTSQVRAYLEHRLN